MYKLRVRLSRSEYGTKVAPFTPRRELLGLILYELAAVKVLILRAGVIIVLPAALQVVSTSVKLECLFIQFSSFLGKCLRAIVQSVSFSK